MWQIIICLSFLVHCGLCQLTSSFGSPIITPISTPIIRSTVSAVSDDDTQSLYFVSVKTTGQQNSIFRYSYIDGVFYSAYIEGYNSPSFILPAERKCQKCKNRNNLFVVGIGSQVLKIKWDGISNQAFVVGSLFSMDANIPFSRTSLSRTSPLGRFYGGTYFSPGLCNTTANVLSFYKFDPFNGLVQLFGGIRSTTGIAVNLNSKPPKLYHLDTCQQLLTEFDGDTTRGDICNGRVVFDFRAYSNLVPLNYPLGLEIDSYGYLYVLQPQSLWVIDPRTSTLVRTIDFPAPVLNALAFGGPNREILYVVGSPNYINPYTLQTVADPTNITTSLFAVTGLGAVGNPTVRLEV